MDVSHEIPGAAKMYFATQDLSSCFSHVTFGFFPFPSFSSKYGKRYPCSRRGSSTSSVDFKTPAIPEIWKKGLRMGFS